MKNKFEDFLDQNKGSFPLETVPKGHREKFVSKLKMKQQKKSSKKMYWNIAASFLLVSALAWVLYTITNNSKSNESTIADSYKPADLIQEENKIKKIVDLQTQDIVSKEDKNKQLVNHTLEEIKKLEAEYVKLEQDLMLSGNEKVLEAMQKNLKARNEILTDVQEYLEP